MVSRGLVFVRPSICLLNTRRGFFVVGRGVSGPPVLPRDGPLRPSLPSQSFFGFGTPMATFFSSLPLVYGVSTRTLFFGCLTLELSFASSALCPDDTHGRAGTGLIEPGPVVDPGPEEET